jgi:hypothetical protein
LFLLSPKGFDLVLNPRHIREIRVGSCLYFTRSADDPITRFAHGLVNFYQSLVCLNPDLKLMPSLWNGNKTRWR